MLSHKLKIGLIGLGVALAGLAALSQMPPVHASVGEIQGQLQAAAETGAGYGPAQDPRVTAAIIIRAFLSVIGIIFIVLTIYAGATWMLSGGNEEKVTKAKNIIKASVIGLAIVLCAYGITALVINVVLGGRNRDIITDTTPNPESSTIAP